MTLPSVPNPAMARPAFTPVSLSVTAEQKLELLEYWRSVTKRKWLILALGLAAALLAGVISLALTPVYRSTATVLIEASKGKILSIEDIYTVNPQREHYQTQVEVLKSREVADRTVRALKLWEHPLFDPRKAQSSMLRTVATAIGLRKGKTTWSEDDLAEAATKQLMEALVVDPVRLSQLVKVSFDSEDAKLAALVANTLAAEYIDSDRDARFKISQNVSGFLQERLTALREKLTSSEQMLQQYREKKGIVSLAGSAQTMAGQQVGGTSERLLQARTRRLELESSYLQLKAMGGGDYSGVPAIMRDPAVAEALRQFNDGKRRMAEASEVLGSQHPKVKQLETEIAQMSATLAQARTAAVSSLTREYEAARGTETSLERALGSARGEVQTVNREEFQLTVLEREVTTNRQLYDMFMSRAKETNLASDVQASVARVVDSAVPTDLPLKPNKVQIVVVAAVLALFVGAMASLLMDRLDNTVKGGEDAEMRLKQPLLAALPEVPKLDRNGMARLFLDDAHSHFSEAIRTARTGVLLSNLDVEHKILLITSSLPGEGKTTVAVNLALAHAQTKKTLLVDCDMRRSQVSRSLGIPAGVKGLTNLVSGSSQAEDCMYQAPESKLMVMPVGDLPPNPLELLLSQRFRDALRALSAEFEMVIIDSPPVELVSEALVLAPLATSTAFVVKAMSTPAPLVRKSLSRLQRAGANILGVMVNQLDFKHARLYYGEYGASSYSYGSDKPAET
jgi:succinoglycan biosynthesis transport protein ExoP